MTTTSAVSIDGASAQPAASSRPAISSESLLFIWQPSVQTKNAGGRAASGRNSARRSSSGANGSRGPAGPVTGGAMSRTGRLRVVMRSVMVLRPAASAAQRGPEPGDERIGHHEAGMSLGVRAEVAVVVRPAGLDEAAAPARVSPTWRASRLVERAVVALEPVEPLADEVAQERDPVRRLPEVRDRGQPARRADRVDRLDRPEPGARDVARLAVAEEPRNASSTLSAKPASTSARATVGRPRASSPSSRQRRDLVVDRLPDLAAGGRRSRRSARGGRRAGRRAPPRTPRRRGPRRSPARGARPRPARGRGRA